MAESDQTDPSPDGSSATSIPMVAPRVPPGTHKTLQFTHKPYKLNGGTSFVLWHDELTGLIDRYTFPGFLQ